MRRFSLRRRLVFLIIFLSLPFLVQAEDSTTDKNSKDNQDETLKLEEVTVEAAPLIEQETTATGKNLITRELMEALPAGNGDLNELLIAIPDVHFEADHNTSENAGEIKPGKISISGGKTYQNNFTIDGISNNSLLDPNADNPAAINDVPGHPQEIFIDPDLVEEIEVYDSNVPAEFGSFTGGVVDAKLKHPEPEFTGKIKYRTTRDEWTEFHYENEYDENQAKNSKTHNRQRSFRKDQFGLNLNFPITEESGLLTSYNVSKSVIGLKHFNKTKNQTRENKNYLLKYSWLGEEGTFSMSVIHAPYKSAYFRPDTKDSDYTVKGGGNKLNFSYSRPLGDTDLDLKLGYSESENSRRSPRNFYNWNNTPSKNWGNEIGSEVSKEGGFGNIDQKQRTITFKADLNLFRYESASIKNSMKLGLKLTKVTGTFERKETSYVYSKAQTTPDVLCLGENDVCVDNEQYFTRRNVYEKDKATATINSQAVYLQNRVTYERLTVTPGVRYTRNDYMNNNDLAPRLAGTYDFWGNNKTIFTFGKNRYYGQTFLTSKLREAKKPYYGESRSTFMNEVQPWAGMSTAGSNKTEFSKLKTPYADETSWGLDQKTKWGKFSYKNVTRKQKDQFMREYGPVKSDGFRYYTTTNNGSGEHKSQRISWNRSWKKYYLAINYNQQETTSSHSNYDSVMSDTDEEDRVYYKGKVTYRDDLPKDKYHLPETVNMIFLVKLPYGVKFTNRSQYRSAYTNLESTGKYEDTSDGNVSIDPDTGDIIISKIPIYDEVKHDPVIMHNWKIEWSKDLGMKQKLVINVEINNVFNTKASTRGSSSTYERGRQIWAGASYHF